MGQAECAGQGQDCKSMTCCSGQSSVWRPVRDRNQDQVRVLRNRVNQKYVSQENLASKIAPKLVCAKSSKVNIGKHQNPENIGLKRNEICYAPTTEKNN